jgi:hypothetical protein
MTYDRKGVFDETRIVREIKILAEYLPQKSHMNRLRT